MEKAEEPHTTGSPQHLVVEGVRVFGKCLFQVAHDREDDGEVHPWRTLRGVGACDALRSSLM